MKNTIMKTLAIAYSFTANNEKLAAYLQDQIGCDVSKIETVKKRNGFSVFLDIVLNRKPMLKPIGYELENYDHIVFLAPIWAGKIAMPLNSFLTTNATKIKEYSFITVCGGGNLSQKDNIVKQLTASVGHAPKNVLELWTKRIMEARKRTGATATTVRIDNEDLQLFSKDLDEFIEAIDAYDESVSTR